MKPWLCSGILVLALALCLAGCAPKYYPPPPPPPPPAPVAPPPQVARPVFYIKANRLNLRACPGMDCPKISVLEKGEEVEKVGESEDWFQIRVKRDGLLGWVDSRYLSATPVTPAPGSGSGPPGGGDAAAAAGAPATAAAAGTRAAAAAPREAGPVRQAGQTGGRGSPGQEEAGGSQTG